MAMRYGVWLLLLAGAMTGQTLNNQTLTGKYYFRHLLFTTDTAENITDVRSLWGAIQLNGSGSYTFTGQSAVGTTPPVALSGSGTYSVTPAGVVTLTNPQNNLLTLNARWGSVTANEGILVGSSTEGAGRTFDLFVAIQAATDSSAGSLSGGYWVSTLAFPAGAGPLVRSAMFSLQANGQGSFGDFSVNGHSASLSLGQPITQTLSGATYVLQADRTGSATFPLQAGFDGTTQLVSGSKTFYLSAGGNVILGGSNDGTAQDIFVGLLTGIGTTWKNQFFWHAGLRFESAGNASAYSGSLYSDGASILTFTRREHQLQSSGAVAYDFTGTEAFELGSDGSGTAELTRVAVGAAGNGFVGTADNTRDPAGYEVYVGVQRPSISGTGVFLNPLGVVNGGSFAPGVGSIAPGEFAALYGTNLAATTQAATPPYPPLVAGVTVLIDNVQAPVQSVSPIQVNVLVPYSTAGPTATIVVNNNGATSNTVQVPVAPTAPGVFSLNRTGIGEGAVRHADFSLVSTASPARRGETVLIFATGLGAVSPAVADGTAGGASTLSVVTAPLSVLIGGLPAKVKFAGLAPGYPGLYQLNVVVPADLNVTTTGPFPLAVQTADSFHDQVDLIVGP